MPQQPESLVCINHAGGMLDFRIRMKEPVILNGPCDVEVWYFNPTEDDMVLDEKDTKNFNTTAEAWAYVGEQLALAPQRRWLVADCDWNRQNYPALIGKTYDYDKAPSYAAVELITPGVFTPEHTEALVPA